MIKVLRRIVIWITFAFWGIVVVAQMSDCPTIVEDALDSIDTVCSEAGRNQACYGNVAIETEFQPDITDIIFADVGDITDVTSIQSMQLSAMDEANSKWGLALLRLQANIPDTTPGQNVTFLLFGDVEMTDAGDEYPDADLTPMQAFYLTTGIGDANCAEAPESGVLVQTPEGVTDVVFNVNGIDVAMGSTIFFQARPDEEMRINALEGSAMMELNGEIQTVVAGSRLSIPIDENLVPIDSPLLLESYDDEMISQIPYQHLEREITPPEPLTDEQLTQAREMIANGELPCGMDGLPDCDKLPTSGLSDGPMCQSDVAACSERLAPYEVEGVQLPKDNQQCLDGQNCGNGSQSLPPTQQPLQNGTPPPTDADGQPLEGTPLPPANQNGELPEGSNPPPTLQSGEQPENANQPPVEQSGELPEREDPPQEGEASGDKPPRSGSGG